MKIGGAPSADLDARQEKGRFGQGQKTFQKRSVIGCSLPQPNRAETIVVEITAGPDQGKLGIELQIGQCSPAIGDRVQRVGHAARQAHHCGAATRTASSRKASSTPSPVRALLERTDQPASVRLSSSVPSDRPLLLQIVFIQEQHEGQAAMFRFDTFAQ